MALTAAQQAALDSVRGRLASQTEDEQDSGLNDAQKAAIAAARARLGDRAPAAQEGDVGFGEGMYNAVARGLSNLGSIPDAMRAEEFSTLADARARQAEIDAERARTGEEAPWWERALLYRPSWAAPLETEEELRGLAADHAQAVAQRRFDAQRNYPMTETGAQAIQDIMDSGGFFPGLGTALMNPLDTASGIAQVVGEQIPTIVGAGAASYVTRNPNVGLAAFAGSGYSQERYGQLVPEAEKAGYNLLDRQGAMAAVSDSEFMQAQAERGQVRGVIIGGVDLITAGLASRAPLTLRGLATQTGVQVAGGGVGEAAAGLATDGKINAGEVIIEALAEGVSAPADVAAFAVNRPSNTGSDINSQEAMALAQEEAALQAQQAAEAEAAAQEEALAVDAIKEARLDARETFISEQEFVRLRNEARAADILNRDTEIGQAFRQWQKDNDIVERDQKTQNQFLRDYVSQNDAEQARQEYLAALDEHAIYRQVDAQRTPETRAEIQQTKAELVTELQEARASGDQEALRLVEEKANNLLSPAEWRAAKMEADGIIKTEANTATAEAAADEAATATPAETPKLTKRDTLRQYATEKLGENWEQDNPELSQLFSDGKGIYSRGKGKKSRFESMVDRIVAEQQQSQPAAETNAEPEANPQTEVLQDNTPDTNTETPVQTEENAETPQPLTGVDAQAEQYAQEKLGPNWRNENPQLLELLSGKRYARFQSTVDTIAERKTPAETVETATKDVEQLFSQPMEGAKLSPNEQKVWDTINDAFQNNGQDEVIQVDGSWNTQAIAEKAGLKSRQAAQTALTRLKPKIAKAYGLDQADIKEALAATRIKNVEAAPDINAPTSELDMADLAGGQGFNTKASANQGAAEGVDAEDVAYTQARSEEPDQYENKRQEIADRQRQQDNVAMVKQFGQLAVRTWKNIATDNAVAINQLSKQDLMEWVSIVAEHDAGMIDDAQLAADQREIEMRYDAQPALENANETATIEGTYTAVEGAGPAEGADTGPQASAESGGQAQQVRGADTGAPRGEAREAIEDAEVVAETPPAETGTTDTGVIGENRPAPTAEVRKKRKVVKPPKFSLDDAESRAEPTSAGRVNEAIKWLIGEEAGWRTSTVKNPDDLIGLMLSGDLNVSLETLAEVIAKPKAKAVVITDNDGVTRAFFFTDNIAPGAERGVVMHEIGSHIGMDNVLTSEQKSTAVSKIKGWAEAGGKSLENLIAIRAKERLEAAQRADAAQDADSELLAYFLEEAVNAGVTPNSDSKSDLVSFVRQLWADFKRALRKLRPGQEAALTAQDLVSMAKGAARLELATDFHGATQAFRAVNADYFGLGNNAVGVGFYVTEDREVGVNYMEMRMEERQADDIDNLEGYLQRIDTAIAENEFMDWDAPLSEQPHIVEAFNQLPEEIQSGVLKQNRAQAIEDINGRQLYLGLTGVELQTQALQDYIGDAELARANRHSRGTTRAMAIVSAFLDTVGVKGLKTEVTSDVRGTQAGPNPAFNKVIFNSDNAVVVGSTSYGDIDYDADGAPHLRPGTVKFSVGDPVGGPQVDWVAQNLGDGAAQHASNLIQVAKAPITATKNLRRVVRDVGKQMPSARRWYDAMLAAEKTRNSILGMVEGVVNEARTIDRTRKKLVNDFLASSTFYQKWGYDPQWVDANGDKVDVTIDPIMKTKYDRLTAEEQQLVRDVFSHGRKIQQMMQQVAKDLGVSQFFRMDSKLNGPYAPLKRFGDWVGQLKSQELLDAEAALQNDNTQKARERVEKLKTDPKHYVISFFANKGEAETFARANRDAFAYAEASPKAVDFDTARPGGAQVYEKILGAVNANIAGLDQSAKETMAKMVRDMYFQTLDDSNARLSGLRRLNRAGFEKDMLRSFAAHGSAQANLIAQLQHGAEISSALVEAKREAGKDVARLMPIYNQLATKFRAVMTPRTGALARLEDGVMKFNSFYMLTSSLGYFFQNQTQPIYAVAQIAGDFGYTKQPAVLGKLLSGYGVARKVVNTGWLRQAANVASMGILGKNAAVEIDIQKAPPELRPLLQAMQDRGVLDVGITEDLSRFSISSEGNLVSRGYREMTHRLYQSARYVEAMNRISSAVAAFKMAQQNPAKMRKLEMTAQEYALGVVEDTQGNFSRLDAPALFDATPVKAPLQFRKFQFQMAWLYIDALKQAFRGADREMRVAGFRKASLLFGYTGVLGGLTAVPMSNAASAIIQAIISGLSGDDEENPPRSLERWIRENVEDERLATLLTRGVPAALGWDFSQKLDQSDIFMPYSTKYVELNPDRDGYLLWLAQIGLGATGTMVGNLGNVHDFINRGDLYRAAEYAMPRGLRSYMETLRFAERGMETRAGLEMQSPTDFSVFDLLTNATGMPSTEINQIRWSRGQQIEIEQWFSTRSGEIRRDYLEAYDARDRDGMAEARDAFRELNLARDRVRPFFNDSREVLRRQPMSNLLRAPRDRIREQRRLDSVMGR